MTLSSALHSAMSGLLAASRASAIVSDNIANALTPGYARRSLNVVSNTATGSGVQVLGVTRHADPVLIAGRREMDAAHGSASALSEFGAGLERLVGGADDPGSVAARLSDFETSLIAAASRPDVTQHLDTVAARARDLAAAISGASDGLREMRARADRSIGSQIEDLTLALEETRDLNTRITAAGSAGSDTSALLDRRQALIDRINAIVPVNVVARDHGQVALYTRGGAILLDGPAARLEFSETPRAMAHMSVDNGLLSGLTLNGIPVRTDSAAIAGGTLAAQFRIRDDLAPAAQADLDTMARDLIDRFAASGPDPTVPAGQPGLFTDAGAVIDPAFETGLAGRLAVNALADPAQGGHSWKLRDGLGAATPGEPGDARLLSAMADALSTPRAQPSGRFGPGQRDAGDLAGALMSRVAQDRALGEQRLGYAAAGQTEARRLELEQGVDTDSELQTLMIVEQAYAANARIVAAVDEMMQTLLRL